MYPMYASTCWNPWHRYREGVNRRPSSATAAGSKFAIVDGDRVTLRQGPGCGVAGNSRSDNRDAHSSPHPSMGEIRGFASGVSERRPLRWGRTNQLA